MQFDDWIEYKRLRRTDVAQRLGVSSGHITDLCNNRFWPSRELARKIYDFTDGDVTPTDFLLRDNS